MNREQLAQAIRTACAYLQEPKIVVLGSQSILGCYDESELPEEASRSREVDFVPWTSLVRDLTEDELESKLSTLNVWVGEGSGFHDIHGIYVEAIALEQAILPSEWENRLVEFTVQAPGTGYDHAGLCLDPIDLCVSKGLAGRAHDNEFIDALLAARLVTSSDIVQRIDEHGIVWPDAYKSGADVAMERLLSRLNSRR